MIKEAEGEMKNLINEFNNGIFLDSKLNEVNAILKLIEDKKYREILCKNACKSYEQLFDFQKIYSRIIINIENMERNLKSNQKMTSKKNK